jgi:hypothetical protein
MHHATCQLTGKRINLNWKECRERRRFRVLRFAYREKHEQLVAARTLAFREMQSLKAEIQRIKAEVPCPACQGLGGNCWECEIAISENYVLEHGCGCGADERNWHACTVCRGTGKKYSEGS